MWRNMQICSSFEMFAIDKILLHNIEDPTMKQNLNFQNEFTRLIYLFLDWTENRNDKVVNNKLTFH